MNSRLLPALLLISCFPIVSCFPIPTEPPKKKPENSTSTITSEEQQKIEEQRESMRQRELDRETLLSNPDQTLPTKQTENTIIEAPSIKTTGDYPFGTPVPGKEGFVFSPYNNKLLDVRGIASGTLVQDTTYPESEKKYFRVP